MPADAGSGHSGPRMRAWVRIPHLTDVFFPHEQLMLFEALLYSNALHRKTPHSTMTQELQD